jgi:hypothetical protein
MNNTTTIQVLARGNREKAKQEAERIAGKDAYFFFALGLSKTFKALEQAKGFDTWLVDCFGASEADMRKLDGLTYGDNIHVDRLNQEALALPAPSRIVIFNAPF